MKQNDEKCKSMQLSVKYKQNTLKAYNTFNSNFSDKSKQYVYLLLIILTATLFGCITTKEANSNPDLITKEITIGTGYINGVYYPAGEEIATIINANNSTSLKLKAKAKTSYNASKFNIIDVLNKDLSLGISQANDLFIIYNNKSNRGKKLRSILTLHTEAVTLLGSENSKINSYKDLLNKRVRTGSYAKLSQDIKDALNSEDLELSNFDHVLSKSILCPDLIQKGKIDAYFFTVGHPNDNTRSALTGKNKINMISLSDQAIGKLLKKHPYYTKVTIPLSLYLNDSNDIVNTIGVKATLFASTDIDEDVIYQITKAIFNNLDKLRKSTPALKNLNKEDMRKGLLIPIHKGALKYYKEAGLK